MLKKRIIFTLLYNRGNFVLSRNFRLQKVGDLFWLQKNYNFSRISFSIDEMIVLDVTRGERDFEQFCNHLKLLTDGCFVPIAAGGGIRTIDQARILLRSGADKVVINTPLFDNRMLVSELAVEFGQQCVVASMDIKKSGMHDYQVWTGNGNLCVDGSLKEWFERLNEYSIGEIYLNSIDRDGTGFGYDLKLLDYLPESFEKSVILAGGAGNHIHLKEGLIDTRVDAVATANLLNFIGNGLESARANLMEANVNLARWNRMFFDEEK